MIFFQIKDSFIYNEISNLPEQEIEMEEKIAIYLNPSVQTANLYAANLGTEAQHMNKIATEMQLILSIVCN